MAAGSSVDAAELAHLQRIGRLYPPLKYKMQSNHRDTENTEKTQSD